MSLILVQNNCSFISTISCINYVLYDNQSINDIISLVDTNTKELSLIYDTNNTINLPFFLQNIGDYFYFSNDLIELFKYIKNLNGSLLVNLITDNLTNQFLLNEIHAIETDINITINTDKNIVDIIRDQVLPKTVKSTNTFRLEQLPTKYFGITTNNNIRTCTLLQDICLNDIQNWTDTNSYILLNPNDIFDGNNHTITVLWSNEGIFESSAISETNMPLVKNLKVNSTEGIADCGGSIIRRQQKFFKVDNCINTGILGENSGGISGAMSGGNNGKCIISNCKSFGDMNISLGANYGMGSGGISGAFTACQGNCYITNCHYSGIMNQACGGMIGIYSGSSFGLCDISGCSSDGDIFNGSGGIAGDGCGQCYGTIIINNCHSSGSINSKSGGIVCGGVGDYYGYLFINNCYSTGDIGYLSGGITGMGTGYFNNFVSINNCYSTGNIGNDSAGISYIYNNFIKGKDSYVLINNCYSLGKNIGSFNAGIINCFLDGLISNINCIISNSYTTSPYLISTYALLPTSKIYIFNSYSSTSICKTGFLPIYYNSTTKLVNNMTLNLTPITNQIDTSKQVSDLSLNFGPVVFNVTKWDTKTVWNNPTNKYPTLKYKNYNSISRTITKLTLDKLPSKYFKTIKNQKGGYTTTLLSDISLNQITNWKDTTTYIIMNNNDIFDGNNKKIYVPWKSMGIIASYGTSKGEYPNIKNIKITNKFVDYLGGGITLLGSQYIKIENCISSGDIGMFGGGICANATGHTYGDIIINKCTNNCYSLELTDDYNSLIGTSSFGVNGNCSIYNSYSSTPFLSKFINTMGNVLISNCYSLSYFGEFNNTCIINNSYTSSENLLLYIQNTKCAVFNSYCNGNIMESIHPASEFYYNSTTNTTDIPVKSNLTPITNKIDTSKQVSNIGSITLGSLTVTPTKWNTKTIWKAPTSSTTDKDKYPKLR